MTAAELARKLEATVEGDAEVQVTGFAQPHSAGPADLIYAESEKHLEAAGASRARVVIARPGLVLPGKTVIRTSHPRLAFARAVPWLAPEAPLVTGTHPSAVIDPAASLGEGVDVGAYAVVGARVRIGARTQIGPGCVIGEDAVLGEDCVLFPRVVVYSGVEVGNRARLHAGVVLGSDGFGYVPTDEGWVKFPQRGRLILEDDIEIQANSCIDRGALGETRIGRGVKMDNLVHVAHNVSIGEHTVLAAGTGIAGSARIGSRVVIGGQGGVADHCTVEDGAQLAAQTGVQTGKTIRKGEIVFGNPARPLAEFKRAFAHFLKLPELARRLKDLEKKLGR